MNNKYIIIIVISFIFNQIYSQSIKGVVNDLEGEPIAFANVIILDNCNSGRYLGSITDLDGRFIIENCCFENPILKISMIGYQTYIDSTSLSENTNNLLHLSLQSSIEKLDEINVKASAPRIRLENGNIVTKINNTSLSKSVDTENLLSKIPGIVNDNDKIEVLGAGEPIIYLNNREIKSQNELNQILPKDIISVEVITNPGVEYPNGTKSVIKIKTNKQSESLGLNLSSELNSGRKISDNNHVQLSINKEKSNLYINGMFGDMNKEAIQNFNTRLYLIPVQSQSSSMSTDIHIPYHYFQTSFSFIPFREAETGISYSVDANKAKIKGVSTDSVYLEKELYSSLFSIVKTNETSISHHLDLFFISPISSFINYNLYADYICKENERVQDVEEYYYSTKNNTYKYNNYYNISVTGLRTFIDFKTEKTKFKIGGDFSNINGDGRRFYNSEKIQLSYLNKENKYGIFTDMSSSINKTLDLSLGFRYEFFNYNYNDKIDDTNDISNNSKSFFPFVNISYKKDKVSSSLSYSKRVSRPTLSQLTNSYFVNQFMYQEGNPNLQEQINHKLEYKLLIKSFSLSAVYNLKKNYISSVYNYEDISNSELHALLITSKNYDRYEDISFMMGVNKNYKVIHSILSLYYIKPFFKAEVEDKMEKFNDPRALISWTNNIKISKQLLLGIYYFGDTGGNRTFSNREPHHYINANLNFSLLKERFDLAFFWNDIFKTRIWEYSSRINEFYLHQIEDQDKSQFGFKINFNFNKVNNRSSKSGSLDSEENRL